ncbi:MAG: FAD-binding oxidoreductase, partial [Desulforhopalus sp.]
MGAMEQAIQELMHELQKAVRGEVLFDDITRHLYATDASDFSKMPVGVLLPKDTDDIQAAMEISGKHGVPIIPRGGGSSLSGQTVGVGLVIDLSKYLKNILEINPEEKWVRVEPGVVLDPLNARLAQHGLMVGPDPSSSMVATLGGMAGNNSTGSHSFKYGMIADHIQEMEVVLVDGSKATFTDMDSGAIEGLALRDSLEGSLYREIPKLLDRYGEDIETGYPQTWRNVAGYRLDQMLRDQQQGSFFNLAQLIPASEGSLATITQIKLGVVPRPSAINLLILHYPKMQQALEMVPAILEHKPAAVELMTSPSIMMADNHPAFRPILRQFIQGNPGAILIVEFAENSQAELGHRLDTFKTWLGRQGY